MYHIMLSVKKSQPSCFEAVFADGKVIAFDVRTLFNQYPIYQSLSDEKLFSRLHLDLGGYAVIWNEDLDLSGDVIYEEGKVIGHVNSNPYMMVGLIINDRRHQLGLSQRQLSKKCGVIQADICKIEMGKGNPRLSTLEKICDALDLKFKDLFNF